MTTVHLFSFPAYYQVKGYTMNIFSRNLTFGFFAMVITLSSFAQQTKSITTTTADAVPKAAASSTATEGAIAAGEFDSRKTLEEFSELLQRHPREVGIILKLDPALFSNEPFMSAYPALSSFVRQHPEVAQNPGYFLEGVWIPGDTVPEPPAMRASRDTIQGFMIFAFFLAAIGALTWLIRTYLDHRRWSRVATVQTELHNKLLDRFTSHEDLLRYVQTAAGKQFLEIASMPLPGPAQTTAAPINRLLWSVQLGVVLTALGIGLQFVSGRVHADFAPSFMTTGVIAICAGLGFVLSAFIGYALSRKLGLLPASSPVPTSLELPLGDRS